MSASNRFPAVQATPRTLEDALRAIKIMQTTRVFTVPEFDALPASGHPNQIAVSGGNLYWWNGTAWKQVTVT